MLKSLGRFHSLVVPLLTWLVLLIPFAFYQRYYVSSQQAYLTEHGFRLLSAVGRQLDSYIDSVDKTVRAAQKTKQQTNEKVEHYLKLALSDLDIAPEDFVAEAKGPGAKSLSVEFGPRPAVFQRSFDAQFIGRLRLDNAIRQRLTGIGEDYFDDVLIANLQGQVLFQRSLDTRITNLDYLVRAAATNSSARPAAATKQQTDSKANPQPPHEGAAIATLSESSDVLQIKLAGADYNLFLQPLLLSPPETGVAGEKLVICGLWRAERLDSSSFALPYSYVIWFGLIFVAAGSFAWPFLKINYMSHTERLRRSHGWLLVLSMFLGTASVTLMVLNASYSSKTESRVDDDLRKLAGQIQKNVDKEIPKALDQLTSLSNDPEVRIRATKKDDPTVTGFLSLRPNLTYPYFDIAFWADGNGMQLVKDTVDPYSTPRTPVENYPFFQDVIRHISPAGPQVVPVLAQIDSYLYSLEPRTSPNTGRFHAVIAAPFSTGSNPKTEIKVEVLLTELLSLVNAVLPPDFGFAVLKRDDDGTVLFHSNPLRNLSEKFVLECKDPAALRSALFSDADRQLDMEYSGKQRRALVTKINHLGPEPLTLIVFHNSDINLTVNMAIIYIGSVFMALYTGVIMIVVAAFDLFRGRKHPPKSIWPCPECSVRYVLIFVVNSLLVLVFLFLYSHCFELRLLALIAGIPAFAILCTALLMREQLTPALEKWNGIIRGRFKFAYVAAAVSLLIAMTVVPSFGFFKFAHDAASEMAAKHGQLRALKQVLNRRDRISSFYHKLKAPQELAAAQIRADLDRYDQVELSFLSFAPITDSRLPVPANNGREENNGLQKTFDDWLALVAPWFPSNELGNEMRTFPFADPFPPASGAKPSVEWSELTDNMFRLKYKDGPTVDSKFGEWAGVTLGGWICLGLLCVVVGRWFFLLMNNIFLAVGQSPAPLEQVSWQSCEVIKGNFLVLGDPRSGRSNRVSPSQIPGINYFDLRLELDPHELTSFSQHSVVALDHFDVNLANRLDNQVLLQLLERLVYKDRCRVVLVSSIDPVYYLSEEDSRILADKPDLAAALLERWTRVMSTFQKVNFADPGKAEFDALVNRQDLREQPLIQWVKEECSHTTYLRAFGMLLFHRHQPAGPGDQAPPPFDPEKALDELVEHSESYYSVLWSTLSAREHLVLYQLAKDGFANTKNERAIRQLRRKGLILSAPMLRIMNKSFRLFVLKAQDQREIAEWEQQGQQSSWRSVKIVFIATAVGLIAWLFYAQKDLFQVSIGYVVTLGAAVTAIANALSGMRGRSAAAPKPQ